MGLIIDGPLITTIERQINKYSQRALPSPPKKSNNSARQNKSQTSKSYDLENYYETVPYEDDKHSARSMDVRFYLLILFLCGRVYLYHMFLLVKFFSQISHRQDEH